MPSNAAVASFVSAACFADLVGAAKETRKTDGARSLCPEQLPARSMGTTYPGNCSAEGALNQVELVLMTWNSMLLLHQQEGQAD